MKRKGKKTEKIRQLIRFPAFELFPPNEVLGLHLLCLMAAYNDMVRITDWMHAYQHIPKEKLAKKVDDQRRSMQWRLILGLLHEALEALRRLVNDKVHFEELWKQLDVDGRKAFEEIKPNLSWDSSALPKSMAQFLSIVRNQGAFHYIQQHFEEGLRQLKNSFQSVQDGFILEGTPGKGRLRFSFADTVRNAAAFGASENIQELNRELDQHLNKVTELLAHLNIFLQHAFFAYCVLRGYEPIYEDGNWSIESHSS